MAAAAVGTRQHLVEDHLAGFSGEQFVFGSAEELLAALARDTRKTLSE